MLYRGATLFEPGGKEISKGYREDQPSTTKYSPQFISIQVKLQNVNISINSQLICYYI